MYILTHLIGMNLDIRPGAASHHTQLRLQCSWGILEIAMAGPQQLSQMCLSLVQKFCVGLLNTYCLGHVSSRLLVTA